MNDTQVLALINNLKTVITRKFEVLAEVADSYNSTGSQAFPVEGADPRELHALHMAGDLTVIHLPEEGRVYRLTDQGRDWLRRFEMASYGL